jgi:hypothetical protein
VEFYTTNSRASNLRDTVQFRELWRDSKRCLKDWKIVVGRKTKGKWD